MPALGFDGVYRTNASGRPLRVYTSIDTRLMFEDFFHKLAAFAATPSAR